MLHVKRELTTGKGTERSVKGAFKGGYIQNERDANTLPLGKGASIVDGKLDFGTGRIGLENRSLDLQYRTKYTVDKAKVPSRQEAEKAERVRILLAKPDTDKDFLAYSIACIRKDEKAINVIIGSVKLPSNWKYDESTALVEYSPSDVISEDK
jgi:hypothetical protein